MEKLEHGVGNQKTIAFRKEPSSNLDSLDATQG